MPMAQTASIMQLKEVYIESPLFNSFLAHWSFR